MPDRNDRGDVRLPTKQTSEHSSPTSCPIVELRQYTLKPGRRDELIDLFEKHLIEEQESCGARLIGQFRSRSNPDQFVWLRGFTTMEDRRQALEQFYYGPVWQAHRTAANDTMIDSDNVLLLKPARATSGFRLDVANRPALDAPETEPGLVIAMIYAFAAPVATSFVDLFESEITPALRAAGATLLGYFSTELGKNTFPALPVREGEYVFVHVLSFANDAALTAFRAALANNQTWTASLAPRLKGWQAKPEELLELLPTRRSLLRHRSVE